MAYTAGVCIYIYSLFGQESIVFRTNIPSEKKTLFAARNTTKTHVFLQFHGPPVPEYFLKATKHITRDFFHYDFRSLLKCLFVTVTQLCLTLPQSCEHTGSPKLYIPCPLAQILSPNMYVYSYLLLLQRIQS